MKQKDHAVSEMVGALLLIGVLAGVFAVVAVMLVSQPLPVQAPAVEFDLFYEYQPDNPGGALVISHRRGDSLKVFDDPTDTTDDHSEFYVKVNGIRYSIVRNSPEEYEFELVKSSPSNEDIFTVGDQLRTSMSNPAHLPNVQFIERKADGSEYLLWGKNPTVGDGYCSITPSFIVINSLNNDTITTEPIRGPAPLHLKFRDTSMITGCSDITRRWVRVQGGSENSFSINKVESDNQTFYESEQIYLEICSGAAGCMPSLPREIEITSPPCTGPDPVHAQFSTDKPTTTHEKVLDIQFFDESTGNIKYWNWDFGNNQSFITNTSQNPIVHFTEGVYYVVLEVGNECSPSRTEPMQVSVGQKDPSCEIYPIIDVTPTSGYAPLTVLLTDRSSTEGGGEITSREWEFGDGSLNSTHESVEHTYAEPGTYKVNLSITSSCGPFMTDQDITVQCPPVEKVELIANQSFGEAPLTVAFQGSATSSRTIIERTWVFGNETPKTGSTYTYTFNEPGRHLVTFTAKNDCGETNSTSENITVSQCIRSINATTFSQGGSIEPQGTTMFDCGNSTNYTITADDCYTIRDVLVDGVSVGQVSTYTFENVQADHTIEAAFSIKTFTITATVGTGGTITSSGSESVNCGDRRNFTITADNCYTIQDVLVDGVSVGQVSTYTLENIREDHRIEAVFSIKIFTITATAGTGGTITPPGSVSVNCGSPRTFTITPNPGYAILDVQVNGVSVGPVPEYSFPPVTQEGQTIHATFTPVSACCDFILNPTKPTYINQGGQFSFTVTTPVWIDTHIAVNRVEYPLSSNDQIRISVTSRQTDGYLLWTNRVAGRQQITDLGFKNVEVYRNNVLLATGDITSVNIPSITNLVSTLTVTVPAGVQSWTHLSWCGKDIIRGEDSRGIIIPDLNIRPSDGVLQIRLNAADPTGIYLEGNACEYELLPEVLYTITATKSPDNGGTLSPVSEVRVTPGSDQTFTISAGTGFGLLDVLVDGVSVGPVQSYTFENVQADHTIHAMFVNLQDCWTVSGFITREDTGVLVPGVRVNVYYRDQHDTIIGTAVSQANGFYLVQLPNPGSATRYDFQCPDTPDWRVTDPSDGWYRNVLMNPGAKCNADNRHFKVMPHNTGPGFTAYGWLRFTHPPSPPAENERWATLVLDGNQDSNRIYHVQHNQQNTQFEMFFRTRNGVNAWVQAPSSFGPVQGVSYFIVAAYNQNDGRGRLYVNGVEAASRIFDISGLAPSPGLYQTGGPGGINYPAAGQRRLRGDVGGVGIVNRVMLPSEIQARFNAGPPW